MAGMFACPADTQHVNVHFSDQHKSFPLSCFLVEGSIQLNCIWIFISAMTKLKEPIREDSATCSSHKTGFSNYLTDFVTLLQGGGGSSYCTSSSSFLSMPWSMLTTEAGSRV